MTRPSTTSCCAKRLLRSRPWLPCARSGRARSRNVAVAGGADPSPAVPAGEESPHTLPARGRVHGQGLARALCHDRARGQVFQAAGQGPRGRAHHASGAAPGGGHRARDCRWRPPIFGAGTLSRGAWRLCDVFVGSRAHVETVRVPVCEKRWGVLRGSGGCAGRESRLERAADPSQAPCARHPAHQNPAPQPRRAGLLLGDRARVCGTRRHAHVAAVACACDGVGACTTETGGGQGTGAWPCGRGALARGLPCRCGGCHGLCVWLHDDLQGYASPRPLACRAGRYGGAKAGPSRSCGC